MTGIGVTIMGLQDQPEPRVVDGLNLMRAFLKIADAADRRRVIELAVALAPAPALASPTGTASTLSA
jgi:hypothetical protein